MLMHDVNLMIIQVHTFMYFIFLISFILHYIFTNLPLCYSEYFLLFFLHYSEYFIHNSNIGNCITDPTNPSYKMHSRLNTWSDITPSDLKIFIAHNIIMGVIKKSDLEKYWSTNPTTRLPFFGKFMSRNKFQSILWNLHICDDSQNPGF